MMNEMPLDRKIPLGIDGRCTYDYRDSELIPSAPWPIALYAKIEFMLPVLRCCLFSEVDESIQAFVELDDDHLSSSQMAICIDQN